MSLADPALTCLDPAYWTASEARLILAPHLSLRQVRARIRAAGITPDGPPRHSSSLLGKPCQTYPATLLIELLGDAGCG